LETSDTKLLAAAVKSGGILTFNSAVPLGAYLGLSRATVGRVLRRLGAAKALHRTRVVGSGCDAWLTTPSTALTHGGKPATRFLPKGPQGLSHYWAPSPTFIHDQFALMATYGFAHREAGTTTAASEATIEAQFTDTAGRHIPDGAFIYPLAGRLLSVAVEVELSKKSGSGKNATSWARSLAPSIVDRLEGRGLHVRELDCQLDATLLVAPRQIARLIAHTVRKESIEIRDRADSGWFFWAEPQGSFRRGLGIGPIHLWQCYCEEPSAQPIHAGPPAGGR
jgi:hypothetical protein